MYGSPDWFSAVVLLVVGVSMLYDRESLRTNHPDSDLRLATGIVGKFLPAQGASALTHSETPISSVRRFVPFEFLDHYQNWCISSLGVG